MASVTTFEYLQTISSAKKTEKSHTAKEDESAFLAVSINKKTFYLAIARVGDILPNINIVPVGHTVSWFKGIIKVHGDIFSVIDITPFLDQSATNSKPKLTISLSSGNNNIAILVDQVLGMQTIKKTSASVEEGFLNIYQTSSQSINVIAIDRLLSSSEFANISVF